MFKYQTPCCLSDTKEIIDYKVVAFNIWTRKREVVIQGYTQITVHQVIQTHRSYFAVLECLISQSMTTSMFTESLQEIMQQQTSRSCIDSNPLKTKKKEHFSQNIIQKHRRMIKKVSPSGTRLNSQLVNQCLLRKSFRLINFVAKNKQGNPS